MRERLAPFLGQRQRFAATIDRIGVKDGWRSAITVLLKDVELADTGDVVATPDPSGAGATSAQARAAASETRSKPSRITLAMATSTNPR